MVSNRETEIARTRIQMIDPESVKILESQGKSRIHRGMQKAWKDIIRYGMEIQ